jgi:hypothetical protein
MREQPTKRGGTRRLLSKGELLSPKASTILAQRIAGLPPVVVGEVDILPGVYPEKHTHKASEPKSAPRSYRFADSVEGNMAKAQKRLGVTNQTTFVEAAILAACLKLGIN